MARVFISYSHDSTAHVEQVLKLSNRLRKEGVDCHIDQYEHSPIEGWPNWCVTQIEESSFVLVVCTETYERRFRGKEQLGKGLGAAWEGFVVTQELYEAQGRNSKFIPIVMTKTDSKYIPVPLRGATHYDLANNDDWENLYRRLTNQPNRLMPKLGTIRAIPHSTDAPLPPLERKQSFEVSSVARERELERRGHTQGEDQQLKAGLVVVSSPLVFLAIGTRVLYIPVVKSSWGRAEVLLSLQPEDSSDEPILSGLGGSQDSFIIAYQHNVGIYKLKELIQCTADSKARWDVIFHPDERILIPLWSVAQLAPLRNS